MHNMGVPFQFLSYKIDRIEFKIDNQPRNVLADMSPSSCGISYTISARNVFRVHRSFDTLYFGGMDLNFTVQDNSKLPVAFGSLGIEGAFSAFSLSAEQEAALVHTNMPQLLYPYVRSTVTTVLGQAGITSVILPIINVMNAFAHSQIVITDGNL